MTERNDKPNFLVYLAYFGLFAVALNTVYLVLPNDYLKWYLIGILSVAVMSGYILSARHYITIGLFLDIGGLIIFTLYGWKIYQDKMAFGTYLGEMLALMMVLRCFKLFRYQDFLAPLVISLTLIVFTAIPSFSAEFVYSLLGFLMLLGLALFLGSVDEFARLPIGKASRRRWQYTYDFLEEYAPVPISKKSPKMLFKYLSPAIRSSVPAVLTAFMLASAFYFTVDHSFAPGTTADFLAAFGGTGFEPNAEQEQSLLTGLTSKGFAQYYTGFDTEFDIARGRLIENSTSREVVMEVESNLPSYWRGKCFDTYTGRGWVQSDKVASATWSLDPPKGRWTQHHGSIDPTLEASGIVPDPEIGEKDEIDQTFYIKKKLPGIVFTAYQPLEIEVPVPGVVIDDTFTIFAPPSDDSFVPDQEYKVTSKKLYAQGDILNVYDYVVKDFAEENPDFYSRYTQLPEKGGSAEANNGGIGFDFIRIRAKAFEVTAGSDTVYRKVGALMNWLKRNYSYSNNPPSAVPPETDAVDYFLFDWEHRRGHCEYFSSSLAVLCRSIGIPARVVTGYTTGSYNMLRNRYIVRELDAHAWTEVFWPDIGWVEFDPMPISWSDELRERTAGGWLLFHNLIEKLYVYDPRATITTKIIPFFTFNYLRARYFVNQRSLDFEVFVEPSLIKTEAQRRTPEILLAGAILALLGSFYLRQMLDPFRPKKIVLRSGKKSLNRVRNILVNRGIDPDTLATEEDCVQYASDFSGTWGTAVREVADTYETARYSGRKVTSKDAKLLIRASRKAGKYPR